MTDLVDRLRERARSGYAHDELDEEAADEIERLRAALKPFVDYLEAVNWAPEPCSLPPQPGVLTINDLRRAKEALGIGEQKAPPE